MSVHQRFYNELREHDLVIKPQKPYFVTANGGKIHRLDQLPFSYTRKGAYDILRSSNKNGKINLDRDAKYKLNLLRDKFKLNNRNKKSLGVINDFLFETQLLHSKKKLQNNSFLKKKILRFYIEKRLELRVNLYKIQVKGYKVDKYGFTYKSNR